MSEINLDDATIKVNGDWLNAEELKQQIKEKMDAGDMKFSALAAALEELQKVMDDTEALEIRTVITKDEYDRLKSLGGEDDRESVRKAIMAFIGGGGSPASGKGKKRVIKCANCKAPIEIPPGETPAEIKCPECNAVGRLKPKS